MLSSCAAQSSVGGHALAPRAPSRPSRLPTPSARPAPSRRALAAPPTAVDPAALYVAYQTQQFGLTLIGMGMVTALASGSQLAFQRNSTAADGAAAAAAPATLPSQPAKAPNADSLVSAMVASSPLTAAAPFAAAVPTPSAPTAAALSLGDIKMELQQAAAAAVAAVKTAAEGSVERSPARAATPAPRTSEPNGTAVNPRLTVQEATRQVQDWIAAWRSHEGEGEAADAEPAGQAAPAAVAAPAGGPEPPSEEEEEPAEPAVDAAAVLAELTADAPVAATPVGGPAPEAAAPAAEPVVQLAAAQKPAGPAPGEGATAEKAAEYKERLSRVVAESKLAPAGAAQAAKAAPTFAGYKEKIAGLWEQYQAKRAKEQELLAKSERILQSLAEAEAAEQAEQEAAAAAAAEQQRQGVLAVLLARLVAFFQAVKAFVQQLVARLSGGSGSGAAAGASA